MFSAGETVFQYQVGSGGATRSAASAATLFGSTTGGDDAAARIVTADNPHLFAKEYGAIIKRSVDAQATFQAAYTPRP